MESTGGYWKPVWNILEGQFDVILANAKQIKNVPGRKTDVNDSVWIAKLLRTGLIERSFIVAGETLNYQQVHKLVKTSLKKKIPALLEVMNGQIRYHHRKMIKYHIKNLVHTEQLIREVENDISDMIQPYKELEELLVTIPAIGHGVAAVIIAELGNDMSFFPSDKHLASWLVLALVIMKALT